jgi:hypothetical protein
VKLLVDADGCPRNVRAIVIRAAERLGIPALFFADRLLPDVEASNQEMVLVGKGDDSADDALVQQCEAGDICISRDILLASRVVERGAVAIDTDGSVYTKENIAERVSMRNIMTELRFSGIMPIQKKGGEQHYTPFANAFDTLLAKHNKG